MNAVSLGYILIVAASLILSACGPAYEARTFGEKDSPGSITGSGPNINDPTLPAGANIVRNASFDQDLSLWEDWGGSSLLTAGALSGGRAVRVSGSGTGGVGQEVLFRVKTGATYQLKVQAKVANATDEAYIGVRFFDLSNATIADLKTRITTTTYFPHTVDVTIPPGASSAKVYLWKQSPASSSADADDFSMILTKAPTAPPKEAAIANPNGFLPTGPTGSYTLVFDDSFSGSGINTTSWNTGLWFNTTINNELQAYRPENVRVGSGSLQLVAENRAALTDWGESKSYASGAINTRNKFAFTFGVVEARLRLPQGAGLASLFYLEPNNKRSPPEINIMNGFGANPGTASFNYKYYDINGVVRALVGNVAGIDYSDSYHTFTVDWSASSIRFFVDGVLHGTYTGDSILRDDAFLVLSLAVGGTMGGPPSGIGFPQTMEVDYVRVWQ